MPIAALLQQSTGISGCTVLELELEPWMDSRLGLAFIISSEDDHIILPIGPLFLSSPVPYTRAIGLIFVILPTTNAVGSSDSPVKPFQLNI
jgi:hypothetical protein